MKALIYINKGKNAIDFYLTELTEQLNAYNIDYVLLNDSDLSQNIKADVLFVIGGDGTILFVSAFASKNKIPIIGINAGNLGFLCEFDRTEIKKAVEMLVSKKYKSDFRGLIKVNYNGKIYTALNDVYLQKIDHSVGNMVANITAEIDGALVLKYHGDGAIVSTSTGSTAYSLSLGGPIMAPNVSAFLLVPIAAHSFNQRPIVYASDSVCKITAIGNGTVGLFVDGMLVDRLVGDDSILINKADQEVEFLRRTNYNFFNKFTQKMNKDIR